MAAQNIHDQLCHLHSLLLEERECAKSLDIDGIIKISKEKGELLKTLDPIENLNPEDASFAETIRAENRRNAYLFWSTLNWIRDSMEFFGKQVSPKVYNSGGSAINNCSNGRLLSGKI